MNGINYKDLALVLVGFVFLSLLSKLLFLTPVANLAVEAFPEESRAPIYLGITVSILFTGLATGKLINFKCSANPFTHALIIGILAVAYKAIRPDLNPLPIALIAMFCVLNFSAIILGFYVTAKK